MWIHRARETMAKMAETTWGVEFPEISGERYVLLPAGTPGRAALYEAVEKLVHLPLLCIPLLSHRLLPLPESTPWPVTQKSAHSPRHHVARRRLEITPPRGPERDAGPSR